MATSAPSRASDAQVARPIRGSAGDEREPTRKAQAGSRSVRSRAVQREGSSVRAGSNPSCGGSPAARRTCRRPAGGERYRGTRALARTSSARRALLAPCGSTGGTGRYAAGPVVERVGRDDLAEAAQGHRAVAGPGPVRARDLRPPGPLDGIRALVRQDGSSQRPSPGRPAPLRPRRRAAATGHPVRSPRSRSPLPAGGPRHTRWGAEGSPPSAFDVVWPSRSSSASRSARTPSPGDPRQFGHEALHALPDLVGEVRGAAPRSTSTSSMVGSGIARTIVSC